MVKAWIVFIILLVLSCDQHAKEAELEDEIESSASSRMVSKINISKAELKSFESKVLVNGTIQAHRRVDLKFEKGGILNDFELRNGDFVQESDIIAQLDTMDIYLQKKTLFADFKTKEFENDERIILSGGEFGVDSTITPVQRRYIYIKSGIEKIQAQLNALEFEKERMTLRSPFQGIIGNVKVKEHQMVSSGDVICTLINYNSFEAVFDILESSRTTIKVGQQIKVFPLSMPDQILSANISRINPIVDKNGLINIKARIHGAKANLFEGMKIKVEIHEKSEPIIVIPKIALVLRSGKNVIFTYDRKNELAKWNYVNVAFENDTEIAVSNGLKIGDLVIIDGHLNLAQDAKVELLEEKPLN